MFEVYVVLKEKTVVVGVYRTESHAEESIQSDWAIHNETSSLPCRTLNQFKKEYQYRIVRTTLW